MVLKHHQTLFYDGRKKIQKNLACIFLMCIPVIGLKTSNIYIFKNKSILSTYEVLSSKLQFLISKTVACMRCTDTHTSKLNSRHNRNTIKVDHSLMMTNESVGQYRAATKMLRDSDEAVMAGRKLSE